MDRSLPPRKHINYDYTFPEGEALQEAIDIFNKTIRAKFDSSHSDQAWTPNDWFDLREKRPIYMDAEKTTPINWYGIMAEFGDTPRAATNGYSAQHYDWSLVTLMNSVRFSDAVIRDLGESLVSHLADIIILHDPNASASEGLRFHGAHRYELDALLNYNDDFSTSKASAVRMSSHFWNKGLILQYYLTGQQRYLDVAEQTAFHLIHEYITNENCDTTECGSDVETRHQMRAVEGLLAVYELTGKIEYLTAAKDIYMNGVLTKEGINGNGLPGGWIDAIPANIVRVVLVRWHAIPMFFSMVLLFCRVYIFMMLWLRSVTP